MFRTILVPLDGSSFAEQALPWALCIAGRAGARLCLVHVHALYGGHLDPPLCWAPYDPVLDAQCKRQEQLYLDATAKRFAPASAAQIVTAMVEGCRADALLEHARQCRADLVVMATHGRGMLGRVFLGGVADELLREVDVPLLLIHPREPALDRLPEPSLERVLVPLDGSALGEKILSPALELARVMQVPCTLLRVVETRTPVTVGAGPQGQGREEASAYLRGLTCRLQEPGFPIDARVRVSPRPAEAILGEAGDNDLIALATHGRGGLSRLLLGSVADRVIRGGFHPVLVFRPPAERA